MDSEEEEAPRHLLKRIDKAFDAIANSNQPPDTDELVAPPTVRRRRGEAALTEASGVSSLAGGFLPPSPPAAGGFLLDDQEPEDLHEQQLKINATHIPLSTIPSALQMLDLPPADEDVMEVFRNAAGGWNGSRDGEELGVSRKDWRAVCLVLLNGGQEDASESEDERGEIQMDEENEDNSSVDQEYKDEEDESMEDIQSDDEYMQKSKKGQGKGKRKGPTGRSRRKARESSEEPKTITRRQRTACREAFILFFPDVKEKDLDSQRIMIKDIVRIAGLLKEKITAEEVMEMLQEFSSVPDKSMSLGDFERMMMAAKLA